MIKLATKCSECVHNKVCKNKDRAEITMNKLKNTQYGHGPNDDYNWDTMMEARHVDITFSCPDFMKINFTPGYR